jgi:hypothetical protein
MIKSQAMTEYILIVALIVIGGGIAMVGAEPVTGLRITGFIEAMADFYINVIKVVSLPFP